MGWKLTASDGHDVALREGIDLAVGAAPGCALPLAQDGVPDELAVIGRYAEEAWLQVVSAAVPVAVNGRPVLALARLWPGDRICFGASCVDLARDGPARAADSEIVDFVLRARGGPGSGRLHGGPTVHLDGDGEVVSAAAGVVEVALVQGRLRLRPGQALVRVDGHDVDADCALAADQQLQVGARRYLVEAMLAPPIEAATQRLPAYIDEPVPSSTASTAPPNAGGLWWLVGLAAVLAGAVAALLYFHR